MLGTGIKDRYILDPNQIIGQTIFVSRALVKGGGGAKEGDLTPLELLEKDN